MTPAPTDEFVISRARLVDADGTREGIDVLVRDGRIARVADSIDGPRIEADGTWLLPGFIDQHIHGAFGADPTVGGPAAMASLLPQSGTTAFYPSVATCAWDEMLSFVRNAASHTSTGGAEVLGVHLEGPYLNPVRRGVHPTEFLRNPSVTEMRELLEPGSVRHVTIAPELDGASDVIDLLLERGVTVAAGHTDASYEEASLAFKRGCSALTHTFNAMRPLLHRDPGAIGAAIDAGVVCELIGDGAHVHAPAARVLLKAATVALITDGLPAQGLPAGDYTWGSFNFRSDGVVGRVPDGTLGGSVMPMDAIVRNVADMGSSLQDLARMTSLVPARLHGIDDRKGRIAEGYDADLVLLDAELRVLKTWCRGALAFQ